jgi:hypothetical protein
VIVALLLVAICLIPSRACHALVKGCGSNVVRHLCILHILSERSLSRAQSACTGSLKAKAGLRTGSLPFSLAEVLLRRA